MTNATKSDQLAEQARRNQATLRKAIEESKRLVAEARELLDRFKDDQEKAAG